jgi:nucleotide-binding universal stress UspA family protein
MGGAMVYAHMSPASRPRGAFSTILCPVDFSKHSRAALRYASALARRAGGRLTVLFVNDPFLVSAAAAAAAAYDEKGLVAQSGVELERFVRRVVGSGGGAPAISHVVAMGEPARQIQRFARSLRADAIVLGSEGIGGAQRLFFGSTTLQVLAQADVPVLAVPPADRGAQAPLGWPSERVLAAIDLGREAAHDVAVAADLARWFGLPLSLVHVVERTRVPKWLSLKAAPHDRDRGRTARSRLEKLARTAGEAGGAEAHVLVGDPAEQIANLATDLKADLLVVTLRGDNRIFGDRKGATTYRVVQDAGTPILAVPAGWRL